MKKHTKIYLKALGYHITDFIPCELTGLKAVDTHHIVTREDRIENLMAITREAHLAHGEIKDRMVMLLEAHRRFLDAKGVKYDNTWFDKHITYYNALTS